MPSYNWLVMECVNDILTNRYILYGSCANICKPIPYDVNYVFHVTFLRDIRQRKQKVFSMASLQ